MGINNTSIDAPPDFIAAAGVLLAVVFVDRHE